MIISAARRTARGSLASAAARTQQRCFAVGQNHEIWRDQSDTTDNTPKVKRRDGTFGNIDKTRGFIDYYRNPDPYRDPLERVFDWGEINDASHDDVERTVQAARCMDCGTPFCQTHTGCPIHNLIPEWNELVFKGAWRDAIESLHKVGDSDKRNVTSLPELLVLATSG